MQDNVAGHLRSTLPLYQNHSTGGNVYICVFVSDGGSRATRGVLDITAEMMEKTPPSNCALEDIVGVLGNSGNVVPFSSITPILILFIDPVEIISWAVSIGHFLRGELALSCTNPLPWKH